jgi:hypothetical protein
MIIKLFLLVQDYDGSNVDCSDCHTDDICHPIMLLNHSDCSNCFSKMKKPCMEFIRSSASFPDVFCTLGQREQLNIQV